MHGSMLLTTLVLVLSFVAQLYADDRPIIPDTSKLTGSIQKVVEDGKLPGACLLVVQDGQTIYDQCFGTYKPDTVVAIASASKWFAAATIMTLVDEGKLSLDDPVSKFLPRFTGKKGQITLRQLLSHTSGSPGHIPCPSQLPDHPRRSRRSGGRS